MGQVLSDFDCRVNIILTSLILTQICHEDQSLVLKQNSSSEQDLENLRNEIKKKNSLRGNAEKVATENNENDEINRKNTKSFSILDKHMKDNSIRLNNSNQNNNKHVKRLAEICDISPTIQLKVKTLYL